MPYLTIAIAQLAVLSAHLPLVVK
jgi:hypothetical protein